jgi:hypothetical protein
MIRRSQVLKLFGGVLSHEELAEWEKSGLIQPFRKDARLPNGKKNPKPKTRRYYYTKQIEKILKGLD